jgi:hypothetical protein
MAQRAQANTILVQLQEMPDTWTRADAIIEQGQRVETKIFGMQVGLASMCCRVVSAGLPRVG